MLVPSLVRVLVVDEEDRPVPQAQVALWTRPGEPLDFGHLVTRSETDATGSAVFRELEAGPYLLAATLDSGTRFRRVVRPLEGRETLLSIDKARRLLGYAPEHSWRDHV